MYTSAVLFIIQSSALLKSNIPILEEETATRILLTQVVNETTQ